jgi:hypothetical protein
MKSEFAPSPRPLKVNSLDAQQPPGCNSPSPVAALVELSDLIRWYRRRAGSGTEEGESEARRG